MRGTTTPFPKRMAYPAVGTGRPSSRAAIDTRRSAGHVARFSGMAAEEIAGRLYAAEGGKVVARNWRCSEGEIDLAVALGQTLVFVEVKARRTMDAAAAALRPGQQRRLIAAASAFLATCAPDQDARIDVVLVDGEGRAERIENALLAA